MIGKLKWRLSLSILNLLAALALSALGLYESRLIRHHDEVVFSPAQQISNAVNAPAFLLTNIIADGVWRITGNFSWLGPYLFRQMRIGFYVAVFLFWWWVGRRVDVRSESRTWNLLATIGNSVGAIVSVALLSVAVYLFELNLSDIRITWWPALLPVSALLWAIALLAYFVRELRMSFSVLREVV